MQFDPRQISNLRLCAIFSRGPNGSVVVVAKFGPELVPFFHRRRRREFRNSAREASQSQNKPIPAPTFLGIVQRTMRKFQPPPLQRGRDEAIFDRVVRRIPSPADAELRLNFSGIEMKRLLPNRPEADDPTRDRRRNPSRAKPQTGDPFRQSWLWPASPRRSFKCI